MSELKNCPKCGQSVKIEVHPEWDEKVGVVYGALIHHKNCVEGMEISIFSMNRKETEVEAYDALETAWNTRPASPRFTAEEREAIECVRYLATVLSDSVEGQDKKQDKRYAQSIATVRAMLTASEIADKGKGVGNEM